MNKSFKQVIQEQQDVCNKYRAEFVESREDLKLGIALNVKENLMPINGLRCQLEGDTTGWYIWAREEFSQDQDFFVPLHVFHLDHWNPNIKKYLGLAPGWRFLIAGEYEDVWYDPQLLEIGE